MDVAAVLQVLNASIGNEVAAGGSQGSTSATTSSRSVSTSSLTYYQDHDVAVPRSWFSLASGENEPPFEPNAVFSPICVDEDQVVICVNLNDFYIDSRPCGGCHSHMTTSTPDKPQV